MSASHKRPADDTASSQDGGTTKKGDEPKKKRKSRWAADNEMKTIIPGLSTIMPAGLDPKQQECYLIQLQIEDVSRKLRSGNLGIPYNPADRSPSPEPQYDAHGKRLNTREFRTRRKLEDQRHELVMKMKAINADYIPPVDYKPPLIKFQARVSIPTDRTEVNFVGLLIGPRGNTLKKLEHDSGTRIMIRGKGSAKDGTKQFGRREMYPGEDEPLHALITGPSQEQCNQAAEAMQKIIDEALNQPDNENKLRQNQLMELAQLNGTIRDMGLRCGNCGSYEHRTWNCQDRQNVTHNIICSRCGGAGHIMRDCRTVLPPPGAPAGQPTNPQDRVKMDSEYLSLMEELGESTPKPLGADWKPPAAAQNQAMNGSRPPYRPPYRPPGPQGGWGYGGGPPPQAWGPPAGQQPMAPYGAPPNPYAGMPPQGYGAPMPAPHAGYGAPPPPAGGYGMGPPMQGWGAPPPPPNAGMHPGPVPPPPPPPAADSYGAPPPPPR